MQTILYPLAGFTPGLDLCKCNKCEDTFIGNRKSIMCEPCALSLVYKDIVTPEVRSSIEHSLERMEDCDITYPARKSALAYILRGLVIGHINAIDRSQYVHISKIKSIATNFFRYWWNAKGTNTDQGFDEWSKDPKNLE